MSTDRGPATPSQWDLREWTLQALTPIWTGDADQRGNRLITTGLLGSIRWWFEVLVRGLDGGTACDPTFDERAKKPRLSRCPDPEVKKPTDPKHHCVVCELFGCTRWARKFRFQVLDDSDQPLSLAIGKDQCFRLRFMPIRAIAPEEWALIDLTLRLIAGYGALGGKTVLKPTDEDVSRLSPKEERRKVERHRDCGLVKLLDQPPLEQADRATLEAYVRNSKWRWVNHDEYAWASLDHFWCVNGKHLARQGTKESDFNRVLGRKEDKSVKERRGRRVIRWSDLLKDQNDEMSIWLAGTQQESKKVFSFAEPKRTFGFVNPGTIDFEAMKERLRKAWPGDAEKKFDTKDAILRQLLNGPTKAAT